MPSIRHNHAKRRRMPRRGKVARLPQAVRLEIVSRLVNGYSHRAVIRWLNKLPSVRAALKREQSGNSIFTITPNNLSLWIQSHPPEAAGISFR